MAKETANNGFIKIDRCILDWQHFTEPVLVQVFIYLLVKANHKEGWWKGHKCERGATMVSIRTMCDDLAMSAHTAIKALRTLESSGEIKRIMIDQKTSKTIITKYSQYQDVNLFSVANSATQSATLTATQSATKQERKERKEDIVVDDKIMHTHEELIKDLFSRDNTIQAFCMNERITLDQCRKYAEAVVIEWQLTDESHNNRSQAIKHLLAQIRKKAECDRERGITFKAKNERLQPMIDFCKQLLNEGQSRDDVSAWFSYWTEDCNDNSGRMRFEAEKAWDNRTRFINFLKRKRR